MRYYLDCEFNGMGGEIISVGLVREDGRGLYIWHAPDMDLHPWVLANVWPLVRDWPHKAIFADKLIEIHRKPMDAAHHIATFLTNDPHPVIIADWIIDIQLFCQIMNVGSLWWSQDGGPMKDLPSLTFEVAKVDAYPTTLSGAIQHNAYWDAMALRHKLQGGDKS